MFDHQSLRDVFRLLQAYPVVYGYMPHIDQMHRDILVVFEQAQATEPDFYDLSGLVRASSRSKDAVPRKGAWLAQQVLGSGQGRAICVNQRILKRKTLPGGDCRYTSPILDQLARLGVANRARIDSAVQGIGLPVEDLLKSRATLDVLVLDIEAGRIFAISTVASSTVKKLSKHLQYGSAQASLFAPSDRPLANLYVPARSLNLASAATRFLESVVDGLEIVPVVMAVDDYEESWFFQANLLPPDIASWPKQSVCIDEFEIEESILSFVGSTGRRDVELGVLGLAPTGLYLNQLPVDRVARPLMFLESLFEFQEQSPRELVVRTSSELHEDVARRFNVEFDRDMRRHDLEDALRASGWVDSPAQSPSEFYLTAAGVGLKMLVDQHYLGRVESIGIDAIDRMREQIELELDFRKRSSL